MPAEPLPMHAASVAASAAALDVLANERLAPVLAGGALGQGVNVRLTVTPRLDDPGLGRPVRTVHATAVLVSDGTPAQAELAEHALLQAEVSGQRWRCIGRDERATQGTAVLTLEAAG